MTAIEDYFVPKSILLLKCSQCHFVTQRFGKYLTHIIAKHKQEVFVSLFACPVCQQLSTDKDYLSEHILTDHEEAENVEVKSLVDIGINVASSNQKQRYQNHICPICAEEFDDKAAVLSHIYGKHKLPSSKKVSVALQCRLPNENCKTLSRPLGNSNINKVSPPIKIKDEPIDDDIVMLDVRLPTSTSTNDLLVGGKPTAPPISSTPSVAYVSHEQNIAQPSPVSCGSSSISGSIDALMPQEPPVTQTRMFTVPPNTEYGNTFVTVNNPAASNASTTSVSQHQTVQLLQKPPNMSTPNFIRVYNTNMSQMAPIPRGNSMIATTAWRPTTFQNPTREFRPLLPNQNPLSAQYRPLIIPLQTKESAAPVTTPVSSSAPVNNTPRLPPGNKLIYTCTVCKAYLTSEEEFLKHNEKAHGISLNSFPITKDSANLNPQTPSTNQLPVVSNTDQVQQDMQIVKNLKPANSTQMRTNTPLSDINVNTAKENSEAPDSGAVWRCSQCLAQFISWDDCKKHCLSHAKPTNELSNKEVTKKSNLDSNSKASNLTSAVSSDTIKPQSKSLNSNSDSATTTTTTINDYKKNSAKKQDTREIDISNLTSAVSSDPIKPQSKSLNSNSDLVTTTTTNTTTTNKNKKKHIADNQERQLFRASINTTIDEVLNGMMESQIVTLSSDEEDNIPLKIYQSDIKVPLESKKKYQKTSLPSFNKNAQNIHQAFQTKIQSTNFKTSVHRPKLTTTMTKNGDTKNHLPLSDALSQPLTTTTSDGKVNDLVNRCNHCARFFPNQISLKTHVANCHRKRSSTSSHDDDKMVKRVKVDHTLKDNKALELNQCHICKLILRHSYAFLEHMSDCHKSTSTDFLSPKTFRMPNGVTWYSNPLSAENSDPPKCPFCPHIEFTEWESYAAHANSHKITPDKLLHLSVQLKTN